MDSITKYTQDLRIPQPVLFALASVGSLFIAGKLFSFLRLVLSAFLLPGTNVNGTDQTTLHKSSFANGFYSCASTERLVPGPLSLARPMA